MSSRGPASLPEASERAPGRGRVNLCPTRNRLSWPKYEQIRLENATSEHLLAVGAESVAEALDDFLTVEDYEVTSQKNVADPTAFERANSIKTSSRYGRQRRRRPRAAEHLAASGPQSLPLTTKAKRNPADISPAI